MSPLEAFRLGYEDGWDGFPFDPPMGMWNEYEEGYHAGEDDFWEQENE